MRRDYGHEPSPLQRLSIYGTITIRVHFKDEENPVVAIRHSSTNNVFSTVKLSLIIGK
jgi:hypothetical protein